MKMKKIGWLIIFLAILMGFFVIRNDWKEFWQGERINFQFSIFNFQKDSDGRGDWSKTVAERVNKLISDKKGVYGVYVVDLVNGESFGINEEEEYLAASVIKVPLTAVLYAQAQFGAINLEQEITVQKADIQDYGTGVIRYQKPGGHYSLDELASLSIIESDNTAAYILDGLVGNKVFADFEKWGLTRTDYVNKTTSAKEMGDFFVKLYRGQLLNEEMTNKLLADLKQVKHNERIPKLLPADVVVAHKEGTWTNNLSDTGIVYSQNPYVIALFTKDINEAEANELLPQISKMVYQVMSKI